MMQHSIKLLDVTLRDGGYKNNFNFSSEFVEKILCFLDTSGVDYIEIGYRNGPLKMTPNIGQSGLCHAPYIATCRSLIKKAKLTVIFHPKNLILRDLEEMRDQGVDAVRICFPQNSALGFQFIENAHRLGFEVCVNLTRTSQYTPTEIAELVAKFNHMAISAMYLADSNGSLTPLKVQELFKLLINNNPFMSFGFHSHNNLFLAQANAVTAAEHGVKWIDSSLLGMGKGAGNLRTEGFVSYLHSMGNKKFNLRKLLEAAQYVESIFKEHHEFLPAKEVILGVFNLSLDDAEHLGNFYSINDYYSKAEEYYHLAKLRRAPIEKNTRIRAYTS